MNEFSFLKEKAFKILDGDQSKGKGSLWLGGVEALELISKERR